LSREHRATKSVYAKLSASAFGSEFHANTPRGDVESVERQIAADWYKKQPGTFAPGCLAELKTITGLAS
jgi:hypothetical protein